jgi:hypothetical protein
VGYRGIIEGAGQGDLSAYRQRIHAGLARLETFQHGDGMFSIWCGGKPGADITARVAHRLLGFRELPFPAAKAMRDKAATALLAQGHRDNQLLPLDPGFRAPLASVEDAVALYFHGDGGREEALRFLQRTVQREDGRVYWPAVSAWGGALETTCDAARVMAHAGDPLFLPAFRYVTSKLVDGMLYSTADTRALIELLAALRFDQNDTALIDGQQVQLTDVSIGQTVTAQADNLIVRVDEQIEINHLEPRSNFRFQVSVSQKNPCLGERLQITVTPQEASIAPLARLYLPGCLAWLRGGANAQTAHLPIERDALVVEAVAVRPGRGRLYVAIHDMYDADKVGTAPGVEIRVS